MKTFTSGIEELNYIINAQKQERKEKLERQQYVCRQRLEKTKDLAYLHWITDEHYDLWNNVDAEAERLYLQKICYLWGKQFRNRAEQENI